LKNIDFQGGGELTLLEMKTKTSSRYFPRSFLYA